jgi:hypothetical protein
MSAVTTTLAGRIAAEREMLDTGTAKRPTGGSVYSGGVDVEATTDLFTSPCKVQSRNLVSQSAEVGARTAVSIRTELHLPASSAPLTAGDLFVVTTPHALSTVPPDTRYRITGPVGKTLATARRYEVEEVVS